MFGHWQKSTVFILFMICVMGWNVMIAAMQKSKHEYMQASEQVEVFASHDQHSNCKQVFPPQNVSSTHTKHPTRSVSENHYSEMSIWKNCTECTFWHAQLHVIGLSTLAPALISHFYSALATHLYSVMTSITLTGYLQEILRPPKQYS